jgi:peroxiredoxin
MRKHDLITLLLILGAAIGAGLFYFSGIPLAGQLIFVAVAMGAIGQTKIVAASFQSWNALVLCACTGGIIGDWFLSIVIICAFLSMHLRFFIFNKAIYSKALWLDPLLSFTGILIYITVNIFHHNDWHGWILPLPFLMLGIYISLSSYIDRRGVEKLLAMGIIEAGNAAPDFSLINYDGEKISLSDFKDKREVLLIFVRGDWCPGCHIMLRLYERERKKFQDKNIMLFAIGPDPLGVNKAMVEKLGLEFAVLSDENLEVSKKYCVRIQEETPAHKADPGVPLPASFLIDKKGIIRYTSRSDNAGEFLYPDIIFDVLAKI